MEQTSWENFKSKTAALIYIFCIFFCSFSRWEVVLGIQPAPISIVKSKLYTVGGFKSDRNGFTKIRVTALIMYLYVFETLC